MSLPNTPRPLVVKVDVARMQDTYGNHLITEGFQVVKAASIKDGIKVARRSKPDLILVIDNLKQNLDAAEWLEAQHNDSNVSLALTPLVIIAPAKRAERLIIHELPDRVEIMQQPFGLPALSEKIRYMLSIGSF
jgi:DNA-binding response OmpR family regulator